MINKNISHYQFEKGGKLRHSLKMDVEDAIAARGPMNNDGFDRVRLELEYARSGDCCKRIAL